MIVGNKVDLLPSDGKNHHQKVKDSLIASIEKTPLSQASIKHDLLIIALQPVSACEPMDVCKRGLVAESSSVEKRERGGQASRQRAIGNHA
ncbi:hypothetical protein E2C01_059634 [Portunus trituberculatus]|uniref:Uncharacterized protein n=1 Tax=Portunus trituberculatus TaxID=210409 RepID=A0A5B7H6R1_PORTR|nr:hypothetical protein [Portunus trituberculatus]